MPDELSEKVEALAMASSELYENMDGLRAATTSHAATLWVLRSIVSEMLRQHPTDLSFLRQELKELPPEVGAVAVTILDTIVADAER